jgi:predicted nucleic acid-binding protein
VRATAGTLVDSSVLLDVFTEDPRFLAWSQAQLTQAAQRGAIILNAVVLAEIAPRFSRIETLRSALPSMAVIEEIPPAAAFLAGHAHADYRRQGGTREAILPDFLIGAHAAVTARPLLMRDPHRVATHIPGAMLIVPDEPASTSSKT